MKKPLLKKTSFASSENGNFIYSAKNCVIPSKRLDSEGYA